MQVLAAILLFCVLFNVEASQKLSNRPFVMQRFSKSYLPTALSILITFQPFQSSFAIDQQYKLPPIDYKDTNRCILTSSSMGQANAARDKLYDLRECDLTGQTGAGKDMRFRYQYIMSKYKKLVVE